MKKSAKSAEKSGKSENFKKNHEIFLKIPCEQQQNHTDISAQVAIRANTKSYNENRFNTSHQKKS